MVNGLLWIAGYPVWAAIGAGASYLLYRRRVGAQIGEMYMIASAAEKEAIEDRATAAKANERAMSYSDALKAIVDTVDWTATLPMASAFASHGDIVAIAKQALETGDYHGRLRAALAALEESERLVLDLREENTRLAELAVCPQ